MAKLTRLIENVVATLADMRRPPATAEQRALGERLATELRAISASGAVGTQTEFWRAKCAALCAAIETSDPIEFMRWPPVGATMVGRTTLKGVIPYWRLRRSGAWRRVWRKALRRPNFGHPPPFLVAPWTDAVAVQHAYHLLAFEQSTGQSFIDADTIVDIGGGYGSMARIVHALGFRGSYVIFDQPPVLALQRYYLGLHGIAAVDADSGDAVGAPVVLCRSIEQVTRSLTRPGRTRLSLLSTWALSEMPLELRLQLEPLLQLPSCAKALLAYQTQFEGVDNRRYFTELIERAGKSWTWQHFDMDFNPGNVYAFGVVDRRP